MSGLERAAAHGAGVWFTGLVSALLFGGLLWYLAPLDPGVLALQFAFTPAAFADVIHRWSAADLARYRTHLPVDGLLLVSYAMFGRLFARSSRAFAAAGRRQQSLAAWLLPAAALCDAAENLLHGWLTESPRFGVPAVYALSASLALLKWLALLAFGLLWCLACWRLAGRDHADPR